MDFIKYQLFRFSQRRSTVLVQSIRSDFGSYREKSKKRDRAITRELANLDKVVQELNTKNDSLVSRKEILKGMLREKPQNQNAASELDAIESELKILDEKVQAASRKSMRLGKRIENRKKEDEQFSRGIDVRINKIARKRFIQAAFVILILLVVVASMVQFFFPELGSKVKYEYFTVIAQLLPVMLIALYLTNVNSKDQRGKITWYYAVSKVDGVVAFFIGEMFCLNELAYPSKSTFAYMMINLAVYALAVQLIIAVLNGRSANSSGE